MRNNKGITLTSLVIYIAVVIVVTAAVIRITTYFRNNMTDVADVNFETEFQKINLYLLDESNSIGNDIAGIQNETIITFTKGNKYEYKSSDKTIYLNDTIKVCENIQSCVFSKKTAENGKSIIVLEIKISDTTKTVEYVMKGNVENTDGVNIQDYLWGGSLVSYYLKAGDYVDYVPDTGTYKVAAGEYGSGYSSVQSFTTETGENALKWRVLSIDEQTGEIELVSETVGQTVYLQGADGYNHGVDILNDLCESLYSRTVNGTKIATARNINMEDINKKTVYQYEKYENTSVGFKYGDTKQLSTYGANYMKYPNIYSQDKGYGTKGNFNNKNIGLEENTGLNDGIIDNNGITTYSTVTGYTDGNIAATDPYITYTYYSYNAENYFNTNLGINTAPQGLFKIGSNYWLASRCVSAYSTNVSYYIRAVVSDGSSNKALFYANGNEYDTGYSVRPVVTLNAAELLDFSVGDGSKEEPWGMK